MDSGTALAKQEQPSPNLTTMDMPPEDATLCDEIGSQVWMGMVIRYEQTAPATEVVLLRRGPQGKHDTAYDEALKHFDDFLLKQFQEWGWKLLLSREVIRTVARWEATEPERLERVGEAMALRSRIFRSEKSAPLLEDIDKFADATIVELRSLFRLVRDEFSKRLGPRPRCERIAEWMRLEVEGRPADYPKLRDHLPQLHGFVKNYLPARNKKAAHVLESGGMRADSFFYLWYAALTNRAVRDVRNLISQRRPKNRSSSK